MEIWKDIDIIKTKKRYQVSNMGNIRIWDSEVNDFVIKKNKITENRYVSISMQDVFGNDKVYSVHRLVAAAFIPIPDVNTDSFNKVETRDKIPYIVNHKNGIKNDNRVENLEWCDTKHNIRHSVINKYNKSIHYIEVLDLIENKSFITTTVQLAKILNISYSNILTIVDLYKDEPYDNRYLFKYLDEDSSGVYSSFKNKMKAIICKDHITNEITVYESVAYASIATKVKKNTISNICHRTHVDKIHIVAGYSFLYLDKTKDHNIQWPKLESNKASIQRKKYLDSYINKCPSVHKQIYVKDTATGEIKRFLNLKEAARANGVNYGTVRDHIYGINLPGNPLRIFRGKIYRLEDDERDWSTAIPVVEKTFHKELIVKNYLTGEIISFSSMLKLIQRFVIHHSYVRKILNTGRLYRGLVITTDKSYNWPIYTKEEVNASI